MPNKKVIRYKKKNKRKYARPNMNLFKAVKGTGIPYRSAMKLKYVFLKSISTGVLTTQTFRLNGLYDPDYTGIGRQPMYYDQMSALYQKYKVYACKYNIILTNASNNAVIVTAYPSVDLTSASDIATAAEKNNAALQIIGVNTDKVYIKGYCNLKKLFGNNLSDDNYAALISAVPTNVAWLHLKTMVDDGATAIDLTYTVTLTFYSKFYKKDFVDYS